MADKTNKQIQDEYASKGTLARLGIAADDMARIAAGGVTGGMLDTWLGGDNVQRTHEARVRAGLAGDAANVGGMLLGLKGVGSAVRAVRAAPTAIAAARSAGVGQGLRVLTNTAGPGLIPVAAAPAITKTGLAKAAGALGLVGLSVAGRQDNTVDPGAAAATPAANTVAAGGTAPPGDLKPIAITPQMRAMAEIDSILSQPHTRQEARQATVLVGTPARPATGKNAVAELGAKAAQDWFAGQVALASKKSVSDPDGARTDVSKAQEEYLRWLATLSGSNPAEQAIAGMYDPNGE